MIEIKIFIKILKLLGFIKESEVSINIPTCYNVEIYNFYNDDKVMNDIFAQIYHRIETDNKFRKRCKDVKYIKTSFQVIPYYRFHALWQNPISNTNGTIPKAVSLTEDVTIMIPYVEGVLYNPFDQSVVSALERQEKINKLIN